LLVVVRSSGRTSLCLETVHRANNASGKITPSPLLIVDRVTVAPLTEVQFTPPREAGKLDIAVI
jgi:hypothetical protein